MIAVLVFEKLERSRILSIAMIIIYSIFIIVGFMNGVGEEESAHIAIYTWGLLLEVISIVYLEGAAEMAEEKTGLEDLLGEVGSGKRDIVLLFINVFLVILL